MCGRYSLFVPPKQLGERFGVDVSVYEPRYNAAPSQSLPVITDEHTGSLQTMEWGLVPSWVDSKSDGGHINARAETLTETPSFRDAFEQVPRGEFRAGRCLVPADGFYEWVERDGQKQPYRVTLDGGGSFAMAGLWTQWKPPTTQTGLGEFTGETATQSADLVESFTVVTTEPNDVVADLHHRMAVILGEEDEQRWLKETPANAQELLEPYPAEEMRAYPVSTAVNDPSNDSPAIVEAVSPTRTRE